MREAGFWTGSDVTTMKSLGLSPITGDENTAVKFNVEARVCVPLDPTLETNVAVGGTAIVHKYTHTQGCMDVARMAHCTHCMQS